MKRWPLGACVAVFGVAFVTALDFAYSRWSDFDGESLGAGDLVWYLVIASPLLGLGFLAWRGMISSVALGVGMLISSGLLWAGFHAAWTDESSTAALALLAAPIYALAAVAVIFAFDRIVDAVRRRGATKR